MMIAINPMHILRASDDAGGALAPMIAFELIMNWFKVGGSGGGGMDNTS